jgi:hypothetical protein
MPKDIKDESEQVVNVTFQLKGDDARDFTDYMKRERIDINSVAGKKLALERLEQWKVANVATANA